MMEPGTIPPPREPATPRELSLLRRIAGDADALERSLDQGRAGAIRMLALMGYEYRRYAEGTPDEVYAYVRGVVAGLRRVVAFPPMQGIA